MVPQQDTQELQRKVFEIRCDAEESEPYIQKHTLSQKEKFI